MADDLTRREFVKLGVAGAAALAVAPGLARRRRRCPSGRWAAPGTRCACSASAARPRSSRPTSTTCRLPSSTARSTSASTTSTRPPPTAGPAPRDSRGGSWNGISQTFIGEVMATRRKEVFLASKTDDRTRDGSLRLLEQSLSLLKTDHLDLWQLHNVQRDDQVEQIFAKDGAIEALLKARDQKMVRFLGITGHFDPAPLEKAIEPLRVRHDPDGAQRGRQAPPAVPGRPARRRRTGRRWASSG